MLQRQEQEEDAAEEAAALLRSAGLLPTAAEIEASFVGYGVCVERGFVPWPDPVPRLSSSGPFEPYEALADALPSLLATGQLRPAFDAHNNTNDKAGWEALVDGLLAADDERAARRALLLFAGLANAYVWGGGDDVQPRDRIPACLAIPLHRVAAALETAPILSHQSNCLYNFARRPSPHPQHDDGSGGGPLRAQDLDVTFSFTGERDEAMFYLLTLEIEATGGPALAELEAARRLVARLSPTRVQQQGSSRSSSSGCVEEQRQLIFAAHAWLAAALGRVRGRVDRMRGVMESMPRHVRPAFFYSRVRPYLAGWKGNPTLPEGVVYEGLKVGGEEGAEGEADVRLRLSGGSAAQSSIIAALDLYLGINLDGPSAPSRASHAFIRSMRSYMPRGHRRFLDDLEEDAAAAAAAAAAEAAADVRRGRGGDHGDGGVHCDGDGDGDGGRPSIRKYVVGLVERQGEEGAGVVVAAYDACVDALVAFRRAHLSVVNVYILRQERGGADDASSLGQGAGLARAAGGKGTGGTGVLEFLAPLKEETEKARLAGRSK